jgi:hypothetical protein
VCVCVDCCHSVIVQVTQWDDKLKKVSIVRGTNFVLYISMNSKIRSEIPGKFRNVVLGKDGEDQLD